MSIGSTFSIVFLEVRTLKLRWEFQSKVDAKVTEIHTSQRISTFNLVELSLELLYLVFCFFIHSNRYLFSYCGDSCCSNWGTGCGILIGIDDVGMCWGIGASYYRTVDGDPESWAANGGTWSSSFLIITVINCFRFRSSFFTSLIQP